MTAANNRKRTFNAISDEKEDVATNKQSDDAKTSVNIPLPISNMNEFNPQMLKIYYSKLFPIEELCAWLSYNFNQSQTAQPSDPNTNRTTRLFRNREWSFTLRDDIYIRFKSYRTPALLKADLMKYAPYKIDIGGIYNIEPANKAMISSTEFVAEEKELVFDIDISDYDDVRHCCQNAQICRQCWPLMACAIKVLSAVLRDDFGFQHLLWVFSGRRGIHCWVADAKPRRFDVTGRSAMIDYLKLYTHTDGRNRAVDLNLERVGFIHNCFERAYDICAEYFVSCTLAQQRWLNTERGIAHLCAMVRDAPLRSALEAQLLSMMDSTDQRRKLQAMEQLFEQFLVSPKNKKLPAKHKKALFIGNKMEIVFAYVYPRIDIEVSRHMNHLLKSPFVIHPKTGKVCTIIDPLACDDFDPLAQITLAQLIHEYNEVGNAQNMNTTENNGKNRAVISWRDTSLKHVIDTYHRTFLNGLRNHYQMKEMYST